MCLFCVQIHGSRDSVVNIDLEAPSTSYGPSELIPPDSLREAESDVLEVIRYQPAHVEYHEVPCCVGGEQADKVEASPKADSEQGEDAATTPLKRATSLESVHSVESETNELQSLMSATPQTEEASPADHHS